MRGYAEATRLVQDAGDSLGAEVLAAVRVVGIGISRTPDGHGMPHPRLHQLKPRPQDFHPGGHRIGIDGHRSADDIRFNGVRHSRLPLSTTTMGRTRASTN
ncbi:hypothetical protein GCM10023084_74200 [Streptomyces lacrimifluminis]